MLESDLPPQQKARRHSCFTSFCSFLGSQKGPGGPRRAGRGPGGPRGGTKSWFWQDVIAVSHHFAHF